jgi:opacity protein-like surface antigen
MKTLSTLAAAAVLVVAAVVAPAPAEAGRGRNAALAVIGIAGAAVAGAIIAGSQQRAYAGHPAYVQPGYGDHYAPAPRGHFVAPPHVEHPGYGHGYRPRHGYGYGEGYGHGEGYVVHRRPRFVEHPRVVGCNIVQEPVLDRFGYQVGVRSRRVCQ